MPKRTLRDVIAHQQILSAPPSTTVRDAALRMAESKVGAILIVDGERLAGIFTERDLLNRVVARRLDPDTTTLAQVMTPDPRTIDPDKTLAHALVMMDEGCYRHVPVVENGKPLGMVSARDALGQELVEFEHELERRDRLTQIMI
ncbi:cyclic nucleotide-binding/CBS domain-containing protein [Azospira restricta]|uniref:CBS domain-containing protein n=1 Tax=Azospira restricta TaxID=404405 RepID=A0A974PW72_9RHOO|nr:CBS domain-containing protein [Azospira restricta]QRJ62208.1 CBS domain-containing protein [Azospira restricta]